MSVMTATDVGADRWPLGTVVNPEPPEPPVGTELAQLTDTRRVLFYRADEYGWRCPDWDGPGDVGAGPESRMTWRHVHSSYGELVIVGHRGRGGRR